MEVDHYAILNLPRGVPGTKLSLQEITKAYKLKALELHPDRRRHDPNAHKKFQRLLNSYEILKDTKTRKAYDDRVRAKHEEVLHDLTCEKMMAERRARDEEYTRHETMRKERELAEKKAQEEEERKNVKMRAEMKKKKELQVERWHQEIMALRKKKEELAEKQAVDEIAKFLNDGPVALEGKNVVEVLWDKNVEDYSDQRLTELFQEFGKVRYVINRISETNKGSAFIGMASEDAVVAATRSVVGNLGNPLLVLPVVRHGPVAYPITQPLSKCSAMLCNVLNITKLKFCELRPFIMSPFGIAYYL